MKIVARSLRIAIIMEMGRPSEACATGACHLGICFLLFFMISGVAHLWEGLWNIKKRSKECTQWVRFLLSFFPISSWAFSWKSRDPQIGFERTESFGVVWKYFVQRCLFNFPGNMAHIFNQSLTQVWGWNTYNLQYWAKRTDVSSNHPSGATSMLPWDQMLKYSMLMA